MNFSQRGRRSSLLRKIRGRQLWSLVTFPRQHGQDQDVFSGGVGGAVDAVREAVEIRRRLVEDDVGPITLELPAHAGLNRTDSIPLEPTLKHVAHFDHDLDFDPPEHITVHMNTDYNSQQNPQTTGHPGLQEAHLHQEHSLTSRHPLNRRTHQLLTQPELSQTADLHRTPHPRDRGLHHPGQHHHHPAPPHPTGLNHPPIRTNDPNDSPDPSAQSLMKRPAGCIS